MKRLTVLLLLMVSTNVFAEWTMVGEVTAKGGWVAYADTQSIRKNGNKVTMWHLLDLQTFGMVGSNKYLSTVIRREYDCEAETSRLLDDYWYAGNMKTGELINSLTNIKEDHVSMIPGNLIETLFNIACSKKLKN